MLTVTGTTLLVAVVEPQPLTIVKPRLTKQANATSRRERRLRKPKSISKDASDRPGRMRPGMSFSCASVVGAVMVMTVETGAWVGRVVTVAGLKAQDPPDGRPLQPKETT